MTTTYVRAALLAFVLGATFARITPAGAEIALSGRVLGHFTNAPLSGASVSLYKGGKDWGEDPEPEYVAQTLANGTFVLRTPDTGEYRLLVEAKGEVPLVKAIKVTANALPFTLQMPGVTTLRLQIFKPDGTPLSDVAADVHLAFIAALKRNGAAVWSTMTIGHDGTVDVQSSRVLDAALAEQIVVDVRVAGTGCARVYLDAWPDPAPGTQVGVCPIHLKPGATMKGLVKDALGNPEAGATVTIAPSEPYPALQYIQGPISAVTDKDGRFEAPSLRAGRYLLVTEQQGGSFAHFMHLKDKPEELVLAPDPVTLPMRMMPYVQEAGDRPILAGDRLDPTEEQDDQPITGRIVDEAAGKPQPGARVYLLAEGARMPFDGTVTDQNGEYHFAAPAGTYHVLALTQDYPMRITSVDVAKAAVRAEDITLAAAPPIRFRLVDKEGKPITVDPATVSAEVRVFRRLAFEDSSAAVVTPDGQVDIAPPTNMVGLMALMAAPTQVTVVARVPGKGYGQKVFDVMPTERQDVLLQDGISIHGKVVDAAGAGLAGVQVHEMPDFTFDPNIPHGILGAFAVTVADGSFTIPSLAPGPYSIEADLPNQVAIKVRYNFRGPSGLIVLKAPAAGQ